MIPDVLKGTEERMHKGVDSLRKEFAQFGQGALIQAS